MRASSRSQPRVSSSPAALTNALRPPASATTWLREFV
jgi:hypothetical protein